MSLPFHELTAARKAHTYADYRRLPEGAPYQLIGGELVLTPAPGTRHQVVSFNLGLAMGNFVANNQLGKLLFAPVDVYFGETEVYQPDILFVARERLGIIEPEKINGAPDLIVEILSPTTAYFDLRKKFKVYEKSGVKEYWVVDPEEASIQVFVLREGRLVLAQEAERTGEVFSYVLSGFTVRLEEVFAW